MDFLQQPRARLEQGLILVVTALAMLAPRLSRAATAPKHFSDVHPSREMIFLYGLDLEIDNLPAQPGDEIAVYSESGALCGAARIDTAGQYAVAVYRDDPQTTETDGALPGEALRFRIWDEDRPREYVDAEIALTLVEKSNAHGRPYWTESWDVYRVELTAKANDHAPVVHDTVRTIDDDAPSGATVGLPVAASDADGDPLTYRFAAGNDDGAFAVNAATGQITVADPDVLDADTTPEYRLTVEVSDGLHQTQATVIVAVRPSRHFSGTHPSGSMVFLYGTATANSGNDARVDDEVAVFTSEAGLCGAARIDSPGQYVLAVYADDPLTPELDGARADDVLLFHFYDRNKDREYTGTEIILDSVEKQNAEGQPYWTSNNDIYRVDFSVAELPTITTAVVSNVTATTAQSGGNIASDGGDPVTARGVCWATTAEPTLDTCDDFTMDGSATGSFVSDLSGLVSGRDYFVRAYATNTVGTAYGASIEFQTQKADQTIDFTFIPDTTYGDAPLAVSATATSGLAVTFTSLTPSVATVDGGTVTIVGAGQALIRASQAGDANYNAAPAVDRTFTVNKKNLTATADDKSRPRGEPNPALTVTYTGFVNGDDSADLDTRPTASTTAVVDSPCGDYPITLIGGGDDKYDLTLVDGTLTVLKSAQTIDFAVIPDKTYGDAPFAISASASSGLEVSFSSLTPDVATVTGNTVTIVAKGDATIRGTQPGNDEFSAAPGIDRSFTVHKKDLTATADNKARQVGDPNPPLTITYSGFVNNDGPSDLGAQPVASTTAVTGSPPGDYPITLTGGSDPNYTFTLVSGVLSVGKQSQTINFGAISGKSYGNAPFAISATASSGLDVTFTSLTPDVVTVSGTTVTIVGAGPARIRASQGGNDTYAAAPSVDRTFSVAKASLTATGDDQSRAYGEPNPPLSISYAGFVNGDDADDLDVKPAISTTAAVRSSPGAYPITLSGGSDGDYALTLVSGALTVTEADQTIDFTAIPDKTYGDASFAVSATASSGLAVTFTSLTPSVVTASGSTITVVGSGQATVRASQAGDPNYNAAPDVDRSFTVNKKSLTVTADDKSRPYHESNPPLPVSYSGFVNGDDADDLDSKPGASTDAAPDSPPGNYPINVVGGSDVNYTLSRVDGTLTVTKANQSMDFTAVPDKTYGDPPFAVSATSSSGLAVTFTSLTPSVVTVSGSTVTIVGAGKATIRASQAGNANYEPAPDVDRTFTVNKKSLIATADDKSRSYGEPNPAFSITYSGFVNGEDAGDLDTGPTASSAATEDSPPGTYPITVAGGNDHNYACTGRNGTLTIVKADQTIDFTAIPDKTYGNAPFAISATAGSGLDVSFVSLNTDVATVNGNTVTLVRVGQATIRAVQAGDINYNAAPNVNRTFTVAKKALTVTANDKSRAYGEPNPALTFVYSGFAGDDTADDLDRKPSASTTAELASAPGEYPITVAGGAAQNYFFTYVSATLTVVKANQTIDFDSIPDRTYGDAPFSIAASASSGLQVVFSSLALDVANVGANTVTIRGAGQGRIRASQAGNANYNPAPDVDRTFSVDKAPLEVTADDESRMYGEPNPLFTVRYSGFVYDDSADDLDEAPAAATVAAQYSPPGDYPITVVGGDDRDYSLVRLDGTLTITKADQTITFAPVPGKTYGDAPFAVSATAGSGLDVTFASLTPNVVTVNGGTVTIVAAGQARIRASQTGDTNFNPAPDVDRTFIAAKAPLTVTADDKTREYGRTNPPFTLSYSGFVNGDGAADLDSVPVAATTARAHSAPGDYPITLSDGSDGNYLLTRVNGTLTVVKANQTIDSQSISDRTYGDVPFAVSATASSGLGVAFTSLTPSVATVTGSTVTIVGAGKAVIRSSQAGTVNYNPAPNIDRGFFVEQASLTALADDKSRAYGEANPPFTITYNGFVNGDTSDDLDTQPTASSAAVADSPPGNYDIILLGGNDDNYALTRINGTLTVVKANQSIGFSSVSDRTYGAPAFALLATADSGLPVIFTSLTPDVVTVAGNIATVVGAGQATLRASQAGDTNYNPAPDVHRTFAVNRKTLTVTADGKSRAYAEANPPLTVSYAGFVNGDSPSDLDARPTASTIAAPNSLPGQYPITVTGGTAHDYVFVHVAGTLTVTKADQTIDFDLIPDKTYGDGRFTLSATASSGLPVSFAGLAVDKAVVSGNRVTIIAAGSATIRASQAGNAAYNPAPVVDRTFAVRKALLTVTADDKSRPFGAVNPVLTVSYIGFVNNDSPNDLDEQPATATVAVPDSPPGAYPITVTGGVDGNYAFNRNDGTLTITKADQTLTFDPISDKVYGDAPFALSAVADSGLNVVFASSTPGVASVAGDVASIIGVGQARIRVWQPGNANYNPAPEVSRVFNVAKAPLSAVADNKSRPYGDPNPVFTLTYVGFVNGDTAADLDQRPAAASKATADSPPGQYPITVTGGADDRYTLSRINGTLTVGKASQTIDFDSIPDKTYGDASFSVSATASSGLDVTFTSLTPNVATVNGNTVRIVGVGQAVIRAAQQGNGLYAPAPNVDSGFTVDRAALTATADDKSKGYRQANPPLTITYAGFVNGDGPVDLDTAPTLATTAVQDSPPGTYPIMLSGGADANYTLTRINGTLTVDKATQTIDFAPIPDRTYGDAPFALSASAGSGLPVTFTSLTPTIATVSGGTVTIRGAGPARIRASQDGDALFLPAPDVERTFVIGKKDLAVTALDASRSYGAPNPAFNLTFAGFVNGDDEADLDVKPTASTTAGPTADAGSYAITPGNGLDGKYAFVYVNGVLTVGKASLTATADDKSRLYGEANPVFTIRYTGFVNGDDENDIDSEPVASTTANTQSPAGAYPITLTGGVDNNYTFGLNPGTLTVGKADQTIDFTAIPGKTYGDAPFALSATASSGLGVTFTSLTPNLATVSGTTVTLVGAGQAEIRAAQTGDGNYNPAAEVDRVFTVGKAELTATADDKARAYGASNPPLTISYIGFVNGDDETDLDTQPTIYTLAHPLSDVGMYPITLVGSNDANYSVILEDGTLKVNKAPLTATADNKSRPFGQANPALTITYTGFRNGDTPGDLDDEPVASTTAQTDSPPGDYPISLTNGTDRNYEITLLAGTLSVGKDDQVIDFASIPDKIYGDAPFALSATATSGLPVTFVNLTPNTIALNGTDVTILAAGQAIVRAVQGGDDRYAAAPNVDRAFSVDKRNLIARADDKSRAFGEANPALTISYTGFVNGDDVNDVDVEPTAATTAAAGSPPGDYPITVTGGSDDNYALTRVDGTLTVGKADQAIDFAAIPDKTYGDAPFAISATATSGLDVTFVSLTPATVNGSTVTVVGAGQARIRAEQPGDDNYNAAATVDRSFTVNKKNLTAAADDKSRAFGEANPALTIGYTGFANGDDVNDVDVEPTAATTAAAGSPPGDYP
ncbi:MAG: cadherin repeat domain-containing protein, partial [Kiritimatiellaeota bacterium]|nr:cadherin repeat domain-containing protein [Kiritimatiellota bacterium]